MFFYLFSSPRPSMTSGRETEHAGDLFFFSNGKSQQVSSPIEAYLYPTHHYRGQDLVDGFPFYPPSPSVFAPDSICPFLINQG